MEGFRLWAELQLIELRAILTEVQTRQLPAAMTALLVSSPEYGISVRMLAETQARVVDMRRRLQTLRTRCQRLNLTFLPSLGGLFAAGGDLASVSVASHAHALPVDKSPDKGGFGGGGDDHTVTSVDGLIASLKASAKIPTVAAAAAEARRPLHAEVGEGLVPGLGLDDSIASSVLHGAAIRRGGARHNAGAGAGAGGWESPEGTRPTTAMTDRVDGLPPDGYAQLGGDSGVFDDDHGPPDSSAGRYHQRALAAENHRLKLQLRDLEDDVEQLQLEKFKLMTAKDCTPSAMLFFCALHDPNTIPTMQQLVTQLGALKGVADCTAHMDFATLRKVHVVNFRTCRLSCIRGHRTHKR